MKGGGRGGVGGGGGVREREEAERGTEIGEIICTGLKQIYMQALSMRKY